MLRKIEIIIQNAVQYYRVNSLHRFLIQVLAKIGFQYRNDSLVFLMLDLNNIPDEPEPSFFLHILSSDEIKKMDRGKAPLVSTMVENKEYIDYATYAKHRDLLTLE